MAAMKCELNLRAAYLKDESVETIYFGGGTPSLLTATEIQQLIDAVTTCYPVTADAEITLEANPDDLDAHLLLTLRKTPVNRFSIGIQSFFEEDLRWMNRAHGAEDAEAVIKRVQDAGFENITADLIYGYPLLTDYKWQRNIEKLLSFTVPHISAYSMTVESQTALAAMIRKGKQRPMDDRQSAAQFEYLMDTLQDRGYQHYEISNFAKPGFLARHNSNYWKGVAYLGIGPSAHSYDGHSRQWNVRNNIRYVRALQQGELAYEREQLTDRDKLNEYIMTSLRTVWGLDLAVAEQQLYRTGRNGFIEALQPFVDTGEVMLNGTVATLTRKGKLKADHIAAELFVVD